MGCLPRCGLRAVRYQLHIYPGKGSLDALLIQSCACANDGAQSCGRCVFQYTLNKIWIMYQYVDPLERIP